MRGGWNLTVLLLVLLMACESAEKVELAAGFSCDFEGRCPGELICVADFTCQRPGPSCEPPLTACGSSCVDLQTSTSHCGRCGSACALDESCTEGRCVQGGNTSCSYCGPGVPCRNGVCDCQGRGALCSDFFCVDLQQGVTSCGACFSPCLNSGERCIAGVCACAAGEQLCDGACTSVLTDPANCGGCGTTCPAAQFCEAGRCVASCSQPQSCAGARCFEIATDSEHCGASCARCPQGAACQAGVCTCPSETIACGNACLDLTRDSSNCGACGLSCEVGEACVGGACACQPGLVRCGGVCTDLLGDGQHCGACGNACAAGQYCNQGSCVVACPLAVEACETERSCRSGLDPRQCGGCSTACRPGERCVDDQCVTERPAVSCSACPCEECADQLCCLRDGKPTCVEAMRCPP